MENKKPDLSSLFETFNKARTDWKSFLTQENLSSYDSLVCVLKSSWTKKALHTNEEIRSFEFQKISTHRGMEQPMYFKLTQLKNISSFGVMVFSNEKHLDFSCNYGCIVGKDGITVVSNDKIFIIGSTKYLADAKLWLSSNLHSGIS